MSRPLKEGLDYFPHDVDMSSDIKIELLETKFGLNGYAIYNKLLEKIYHSGGKFNFKDENFKKLYCKKWNINETELEQIISYMIEIKLFEDNSFFSNGIKKRIKTIIKERKRQRDFYKKKTKFQGVKTPLKDSRNDQETGEIKVNKIKVNKSKVNKSKEIETDLILSVWNNFSKENNLSQIIKLTKSRTDKLESRLKESDFNIYKICEKIKESNFLLGKTKDWKVDFDFIIANDKNYLKILEGKYNNGNNSNTNTEADRIKRAFAT